MQKQRLLLAAAAAIISAGVLLNVFVTVDKNRRSDRILPNIHIDRIHVGEMDQTQAVSMLTGLYKDKTEFAVRFLFEDEPISTLSAQDINYRLPIKSVVEQAYLVGRGQNLFASAYQATALTFKWEEYNFELTPEFDQAFIVKFLNELNESYRVEPQEARFEFSDNKVNAFQLDRKGYELDTAKAVSDLTDELVSLKKKPQKTITVKLAKKIIEPKTKLKEINDLGITELVAEGTSLFWGSAPERVHNVVTGANKLNGIIIKPGETFSFVKEIGDISSATGFMPAFVISNGRTVLGDGGGICQVSTTLFRAALNSGLEITERHPHAYRVGYYEQDSRPGMDATIYAPSIDLKFRNDYQSALLIQTNVDLDNMRLTFSIYGTKDGRNVEISPIAVWNESPPPPAQYIDDFSIPTGQTKQVDFAAWGASSKFTYKVTKDGRVLHEEDFVSHFRPWKAIYLVGKKTD